MSKTMLTGLLLLATLTPGCGKQYLAGRIVKQFTGAPTRFHVITPVSAHFGEYRLIEVAPIENLLPGHVPPAVERRITDELSAQLRVIDPRLTVRGVDESNGEPDARPVLRFEAFIDDYDAGYRALRLAELGFNHLVLTIRFQLRDEDTGEIVAAASVTAQDNRVTATNRGAVNRIAHKIRKFLAHAYTS